MPDSSLPEQTDLGNTISPTFNVAGQHLALKLGKKAARPLKHAIKLSDYIKRKKLAPLPRKFGHLDLVPPGWGGMLGNDQVGNCVLCAEAGASVKWNYTAGRTVEFSAESVISDYTALTGYDPSQTDAQGNNPTDQGTDLSQAIEFWKTKGALDASGQRHLIVGAAEVDRQDVEMALYGAWWFQGVHFGIECPNSAQDQFAAGQPWNLSGDLSIEGGHDTLLGGYDADAKNGAPLKLRTWGATQLATIEWAQAFNDQIVIPLSLEMLITANQKTIDGFAIEELTRDLQVFG